MKNYTAIFAIAALAMASCAKEMTPSTESVLAERTFTASTSAESKTVLVDGVKTYWTAGDAISILDGTANNEFTSDITGTVATADFRGNAAQAETYYAVYPYAAATTLEAGVIRTVLPSSQSAVSGSFDPAATILAGKTSTDAITFKPAVALLKLSIPAGVATVTVSANGGEKLAGSMDIAVEEALAVSGGSEASVTLSGSALAEGEFYVAVLPGTYAQGLSVTLAKADGSSLTKKSSKSATLACGKIYDMGTINGTWASTDFSAPETLFLGGSAAEKDAQQMRKEENKFVIFNTIAAGEFTLTDGNGDKYFADAAGHLLKGDGATATEARADVTRIIVDFSAKTISYDKIGNTVYVENAWDHIVMANLKYTGDGFWQADATVKFAANGDERYSLRPNINGTDMRWGSNKGNNGTAPDGTDEFWRLYESTWAGQQWNNLYKFEKGLQNKEAHFAVDGNNLAYMRHSVTPIVTSDAMTLNGAGAEFDGQEFRKVSDGKYVIYSRLKGGNVHFSLKGENWYPNGTTLVKGEGEGTVAASADNYVTRITVNTAESTVTFETIDAWAHLKFACNYFDVAHLQYQGNGIYKASNVTVELVNPSTGKSNPPSWLSWVEDRYYFILSVNGNQMCWGRHDAAVHYDNKYNGDESFWNIDEFAWSQWDHCWKFDGSVDGATVDIEINTNADGKWLHTITKK